MCAARSAITPYPSALVEIQSRTRDENEEEGEGGGALPRDAGVSKETDPSAIPEEQGSYSAKYRCIFELALQIWTIIMAA